jgi:hypothetical protein
MVNGVCVFVVVRPNRTRLVRRDNYSPFTIHYSLPFQSPDAAASRLTDGEMVI